MLELKVFSKLNMVNVPHNNYTPNFQTLFIAFVALHIEKSGGTIVQFICSLLIINKSQFARRILNEKFKINMEKVYICRELKGLKSTNKI